MAYDLTVLDPTEFEALVGDLLSRSWGTRLESFKPGKDGGIDLRHSRVPSDEPTIIVQCKRYAANALSRLETSCRKELPKLAKLEPERYILATTVPLSPDNKDKLVAALAPWCRSTADIYGPDELNGLLREFPDVVRAHFKLWIAGTAVLERVLHAGLFSFTEAKIEEARHRLSTLVVHDGLKRALDLLHQRHHVLIVGNPGIGKTTLAEMLVCRHLAQGFDAAWVMTNIRDAWDRIRAGDDKSQRLVFVYDDFLGRLRFESPRFEKNEEVSLFTLVEKVARSQNLRLILTTREYILEDAKQLHGIFDERADALLKYVLSLEDYAIAHRAQMVFNHLYFSDLPQTRIERFVEAKAYRYIVNHRHFNPRIVESISKYANSQTRSDEDFIAFVKEEFDNPAKLWEHPYRQEIGPLARQILSVLWTFGGTAELGQLRDAMSRTVDSTADPEFGHAFDMALKQIEGNFVVTDRYPLYLRGDSKVYVVAFQNPSIEEFIEQVITCDTNALASLSTAAATFKQVKKVLQHIGTRKPEEVSPNFWTTMRANSAKLDIIPNGHLQRMIAGSSKEPRTYWSQDVATTAQIVETRLAIDARAGVDDRDSQTVKEHVLTTAGWRSTIDGLCGSESVSSHVLELQRWVVELSCWTGEEKAISERCLREALLEALSRQHLWISETQTVVELCKAATLVTSDLDDQLRQALKSAAMTTTYSNRRDQDDPDILRWEADSLRELGELLSWNVTPTYDELIKRAQELEEQMQSDDQEDAERLPEIEKSPDAFDIDELFAGLLDR